MKTENFVLQIADFSFALFVDYKIIGYSPHERYEVEGYEILEVGYLDEFGYQQFQRKFSTLSELSRHFFEDTVEMFWDDNFFIETLRGGGDTYVASKPNYAAAMRQLDRAAERAASGNDLRELGQTLMQAQAMEFSQRNFRGPAS